MMQLSKIQRLTTAGLLVAVGLILPFGTSHAFQIPGTLLLPMHLPVLLMGLLCGPIWGAVGGGIIPLLSSLMTNMPVAFPMLPIMMGELFAYGLVSGLVYYHTPLGKRRWGVYPALVTAMISGRVIYGLIFAVLTQLYGTLKALSVWGAVLTGLPGIAIQLVLIPLIVAALRRDLPGMRRVSAFAQAVERIEKEADSCVVVKDGAVVAAATGRGIRPVLEFYEQGILQGASVADKIVGKAAAMVFSLGGVTRVYGRVMSRAAKEYLNQKGIENSCGVCIDLISNRAGNGICPMEETVASITNEEEAYTALKQKWQELAKY